MKREKRKKRERRRGEKRGNNTSSHDCKMNASSRRCARSTCNASVPDQTICCDTQAVRSITACNTSSRVLDIYAPSRRCARRCARSTCNATGPDQTSYCDIKAVRSFTAHTTSPHVSKGVPPAEDMQEVLVMRPAQIKHFVVIPGRSCSPGITCRRSSTGMTACL